MPVMEQHELRTEFPLVGLSVRKEVLVGQEGVFLGAAIRLGLPGAAQRHIFFCGVGLHPLDDARILFTSSFVVDWSIFLFFGISPFFLLCKMFANRTNV